MAFILFTVFQEAQFTVDVIAAIATSAAAIFSYFAVRNASESNSLARKQIDENTKFIERNNRPVLDVFIKDYKVNLNESFFEDWRKPDTDEIVPKYASSYYLEIKNIGNITARNVKVSFNYEGIDEIIKKIKQDEVFKDILKTKEVSVFPDKITDNGIEYNEFLFDERKNGKFYKRELCKDASYIEYFGSVQPNNNESNGISIYLPKLYIYLVNIFATKIQDEELELNLIFNIKYKDPFDERFIQKFKVSNKIRRVTRGSDNEIIGKLIAEEILNKKIEKEEL